MSNTMKTIIFIISLFTFLLFFILVNFIISPGMILNSTIASFLTALLYIMGYIAALYTQALMKYLYTRSLMKDLNTIKLFPAKTFEIRDRLILLTLPIIAVFMPMVSKMTVARENLVSFAYLAALALIIEALFLINGRTLKIHVTNRGFAINGMDIRLELSIPFSYTNAVGWYPFERIENYLISGSKILLYPTYDMGVITFECSEEEAKQIKGLLVSNRVPERRY
ncbi:MAG: hypothetical protein APF77_18275 [Clostridia bacterium BRH_c25]|nr:MAG: hypothetical protein APF77_18275 [Clostridia bacterium BRH_c25]